MSLCAVVLAAGEGRRLRPLTRLRPKPLCPVNTVPLLDLTLSRLAAAGLAGPDRVAVNACYLADRIAGHLDGRAHLSIEPAPPLGTAGGVANLRAWTAGRDVLVCNADSYLSPGDTALARLLAGWDGQRPRLLVVPDATRGDFGELASRSGQHSGELASRSGQHSGEPASPGRHGSGEPGSRRGRYGGGRRWLRFAGMSLLPAAAVAGLRAEPSELSLEVWRPAEAAGVLELVRFDGTFHDCGTPADYLAANLHASGGTSVIDASATVAGEVTRTVVWPHATVAAGERLSEVIRAVLPDGSALTVPAGRYDGSGEEVPQ